MRTRLFLIGVCACAGLIRSSSSPNNHDKTKLCLLSCHLVVKRLVLIQLLEHIEIAPGQRCHGWIPSTNTYQTVRGTVTTQLEATRNRAKPNASCVLGGSKCDSFCSAAITKPLCRTWPHVRSEFTHCKQLLLKHYNSFLEQRSRKVIVCIHKNHRTGCAKHHHNCIRLFS